MRTTSSELVSSVVGLGGVRDLGRGGLILDGEVGSGAIGVEFTVGEGLGAAGLLGWGGVHGLAMGGGTTKSCWMSIVVKACSELLV